MSDDVWRVSFPAIRLLIKFTQNLTIFARTDVAPVRQKNGQKYNVNSSHVLKVLAQFAGEKNEPETEQEAA